MQKMTNEGFQGPLQDPPITSLGPPDPSPESSCLLRMQTKKTKDQNKLWVVLEPLPVFFLFALRGAFLKSCLGLFFAAVRFSKRFVNILGQYAYKGGHPHSQRTNHIGIVGQVAYIAYRGGHFEAGHVASGGSRATARGAGL